MQLVSYCTATVEVTEHDLVGWRNNHHVGLTAIDVHYLRDNSLNHPRLSAAACHHADEIISSPRRASRASGPLGPYAFRLIVEPSQIWAWLLIVSGESSQQFTGFATRLSARWAYLLSRLHGCVDLSERQRRVGSGEVGHVRAIASGRGRWADDGLVGHVARELTGLARI